MKIQASYWRDGAEFVNLGDWLTEFIIEKMGHEFVRYGSGQPFDNDATLVACGSIPNPAFDAIKGPIDVWGSGLWDRPLDKEGIIFHAVRGPLSRDKLGLPATTPLGDPGLLIPRFLPKHKPHGRTLYIPHYEMRMNMHRDAASHVGAHEILDFSCQRHQAEDTIKYVSGAGFILSGSLHGCILAHAYGIPWAACFPHGHRLVMPDKWKDWFSYLGVKASLVRNFREGVEWWEKEGKDHINPSLEPLINSFPYLKNKPQL